MKNNDKTNEISRKQFYEVRGVNALYALYLCENVIRTEDRHGYKDIAVGSHDAYHIRNLSSDYSKAISKAEAYVRLHDPELELKIQPKKDLYEYSTERSGAMSEKLAKIEDFAKRYPSLVDLFHKLEDLRSQEDDLKDHYYEIQESYYDDGNIKAYPFNLEKRIVKLEHEDLIDEIYSYWKAGSTWLFRDVMVQSFGQYRNNKTKQSFTEAQEDLVVRIGSTILEKQPELRSQYKQWREEKKNAKPVPEFKDRVVVKGEIQNLTYVETEWGCSPKIIVKVAEGYTLWGTLPAGIERRLVASKESTYQRPDFKIDTQDGQDLVGSTIEFLAKVERSDKDPKFGFFKRPSMPTIEEVQ